MGNIFYEVQIPSRKRCLKLQAAIHISRRCRLYLKKIFIVAYSLWIFEQSFPIYDIQKTRLKTLIGKLFVKTNNNTIFLCTCHKHNMKRVIEGLISHDRMLCINMYLMYTLKLYRILIQCNKITNKEKDMSHLKLCGDTSQNWWFLFGIILLFTSYVCPHFSKCNFPQQFSVECAL